MSTIPDNLAELVSNLVRAALRAEAVNARGERRPHIDSEDCWCEPFCYYKSEKTGREVWVHRQSKAIHSTGFHMRLMDNPPPEVLSEAVRLADDADENEHTDWKP